MSNIKKGGRTLAKSKEEFALEMIDLGYSEKLAKQMAGIVAGYGAFSEPAPTPERLEAGEPDAGMVEALKAIAEARSPDGNRERFATASEMRDYASTALIRLKRKAAIASLTPSPKPVAEGKQALPEQTCEMVNETLLAALIVFADPYNEVCPDDFQRAHEAITAAEQQKGKCDE